MRRPFKLILIGVPTTIVGVLLFTVEICRFLAPIIGQGDVCLDYGPILPIPGVFLALIGVLMIGAGIYRLLDRER
ncbi:MAG: hypothetical protein V3U17_01660 [Thermoplasmata archaeon]